MSEDSRPADGVQCKYATVAGVEVCQIITNFTLNKNDAGSTSLANEAQVARLMDALVQKGMGTFATRSGPDGYLAACRRMFGRSNFKRACSLHFVRLPAEAKALNRRTVEDVVDECLLRSQSERLDFAILESPNRDTMRCIEVIGHMLDIERSGKIRAGGVGVDNFSVSQLRQLYDEGLTIGCMSVPFSVLQQRARAEVAAFCKQHDIKLFGTNPTAGGLLSSRWLGAPEPLRIPGSLSQQVSAVHRVGGWGALQELLFCLAHVAEKHRASISQVALRWALQHGVDAVIFDVVVAHMRDGNAVEDEECMSNVNVFSFVLDESDIADLARIAKRSLS